MAFPRVGSLCFVVFLIAGILAMGNSSGVHAQRESSIPSLIAQCRQYVLKPGPKTAPSAACCSVVKTLDIPCFCKLITKEIEQVISMEKIVFVAKSCGRTVAKGTKCGSYTVPNALGRIA